MVFLAVYRHHARICAAFHRHSRTKMVRTMQLATLLLPLTSMLHFNLAFQYLALASQFIFCGMVVGMLFVAWRRGRLEAGVMLFPFLFAAAADSIESSLDFLASANWIPAMFAPHRYHLGPIEYSLSTVAYLVFLCSLISVILYRFVHVSQEEQRSSAELKPRAASRPCSFPPVPSTKTSRSTAPTAHQRRRRRLLPGLPLKDDSMLIVVGDVSGKGLQAAMNASTLVGALRNELSHDPATVLSHLNQVMLGASLGSGAGGPASFATCLCARIYPTGQMTIANAGHLSPYRDGRELELAPDLPLGIVPNIQYEQANFQLKPGDRLIFLSDGVVEASQRQRRALRLRTHPAGQPRAGALHRPDRAEGSARPTTSPSSASTSSPRSASAPLLQSLQ
jgi:hypothetical protein